MIIKVNLAKVVIGSLCTLFWVIIFIGGYIVISRYEPPIPVFTKHQEVVCKINGQRGIILYTHTMYLSQTIIYWVRFYPKDNDKNYNPKNKMDFEEFELTNYIEKKVEL